MNKLPCGITGFWKIGQKNIPKINILLIERLIEKFENSSEFWNVILTKQQHDNNFYQIRVNDKTGSYLIGINSSYPMFCGIKNSSDWTTVEFCDLPKNITDIVTENFKELKTEFLNQSLNSDNLTLLNKVELEQIEYWETEKIGNVIFNKYD
ncbi:hypothetical protein [Winogradskyella sp. R77965]|uniref:hypothetical protein n=1 Tax=Winogradskyella sp. R77965 TaxID=3093872 RepID=UPI0037DC74E9